jgi:outer membrane protein TolC
MNCITLRVSFAFAVALAFAQALPAGTTYEKEVVTGPPAFEEMVRRPLSLGEALNIAATRNATILAAKSEVEARYGIAIQVRAIVLPKALAEIGYSVSQDSLIEANENSTIGPIVNNQAWSSDVRIVQSIYEGGRMLSAIRQNRLIREQTMLDFRTTVADVLLQVRIAYDDAQLAALQIRLRQQSFTILGSLSEKVAEQLAVGLVSEFEDLRAKVEQANAATPLALARQDFVIAKQRLVQLMGYDEPVTAANNLGLQLTTPLRSPAYDGELATALAAADVQRTELGSLALAQKLGDEAIVVAKSAYFPSVQVFAGYGALSRAQSRDPGDPVHGALTGIQLSWAIFDGQFTAGRVMEARARRDQIGHNTDDVRRRVGLEVRTAWERMRQARVILETQGGNVKAADRTIGLAETRFTTGSGTQLEILSAQTALTDARDFYATALRNYSVAYSQLLRATGEDMSMATSRGR